MQILPRFFDEAETSVLFLALGAVGAALGDAADAILLFPFRVLSRQTIQLSWSTVAGVVRFRCIVCRGVEVAEDNISISPTPGMNDIPT